jgi:hypothetical protein
MIAHKLKSPSVKHAFNAPETSIENKRHADSARRELGCLANADSRPVQHDLRKDYIAVSVVVSDKEDPDPSSCATS